MIFCLVWLIISGIQYLPLPATDVISISNAMIVFGTVEGKYTGCPNKNATPIFLYISVRINSTVLCFIKAEIGGPSIHFTYINMSER